MDLIDTFLRLIDAHGISQRTVCKAIGYTSPNQLTRLLKRQVSEELMADFGTRLLSGADMLGFSPDEQQTIRDCIADIGLSSDNLAAFHRLLALLQNPSVFPSTAPVPQISLVSPSGEAMGTLAECFRDASSLHITAAGGCPADLLQGFQALEGGCGLSVDFYYREGSGAMRTVSMLEAVWSILHKPWFHPWCVRFSQGPGRNSLLDAGIMIVDAAYNWPGGTVNRGSILVSLDSRQALCLPLPDAYQRVSSMIVPSGDAASISPMKYNVSSFGSYLDYLSYISDLEHNYRVFQIKRDIGLDLIPASIQLAALREGPMGGEVAGTPLEAKLWAVENDRYCNSLDKRQHQYHVFSYAALREFARTGRLSDHFWGFRPFLPEERLSILNDLYTRATACHAFHLLLLKPDQQIAPDEIVWYNGRGVCFILPGSDYSLDGNHSEFLLEDKDFCRFFSGLFRNRLCERWTCSEQMSADMLKRIIRELRATIDGGSPYAQ